MILGFDCEDYAKDENGNYQMKLDGTGDYFILGAIAKETGRKKVFHDKKKMWNYIIELGRKESRRGKRLICYSHNIKYDFYQISDIKDANIRRFSENPFIAGYYFDVERKFSNVKEFDNWLKYSMRNRVNYQIIEDNRLVDGSITIMFKREGIKFLDSISLFGMSLKKLGELIGHKKEEIPIEIGKRFTKEKLKRLGDYCKNDCVIIIKAMKMLKKKLREDGINIRNLCTINQIAISYVINKLKEGNNEHILQRSSNGKLSEFTWKTKYRNEIHEAYRGGYVKVWRTGELKNLTVIDYNSLYPYACINMRFPDLRTERRIERPLESYGKRILDEIGISKAMLINEKNKLGLLQIRIPEKSYVPKDGKILIGTWTNMEIKKALEEGYKLIDIEWSIIWKEGENPFEKIYGDLYKKRKESKTEFDNYFYKRILNGSIGKFGQTRINQELFIDSVEKVNEYMEKKYKMIRRIEGTTDILFVNEDVDKGEMKKYYAPIIPTLVTASARLIMYDNYKKIPIEKLVYTDTDSIVMEGDYREKFEIGKDMGQFKVEKDVETGEELVNVNGLIWGTKAKCIGNNIALSGVFKSDLNMEKFRKGEVETKRMKGIKSGGRAGEFTIEKRSLRKQLKEFMESEKILEEEKMFIDNNIIDISYFGENIKKLDVAHGNKIVAMLKSDNNKI